MPNGILRVDKNNSDKPISMRLGHYALPKLDKEIITTKKTVEGKEVTIIDNGKYQLAMVPLLGWSASEIVNAKGLHPESNESTVINVTANSDSNKSTVYATLMLWKKSGEKWNNKELVPIKVLEQGNGTIIVDFKNGKKTIIDYNKN